MNELSYVSYLAIHLTGEERRSFYQGRRTTSQLELIFAKFINVYGQGFSGTGDVIKRMLHAVVHNNVSSTFMIIKYSRTIVI